MESNLSLKFDIFKIGFPIILLLWVGTILDPQGGLYQLKYLVLILAGFWTVAFLFFQRKLFIPKIQLYYLIWFSFLLPIYGLLISLISGGFKGEFIDTSYLSSSFFLLFTLLYTANNLEFSKKVFIFSCRALSIIIISVFAFALLDLEPNPIWFFVEHDMAFFGIREFGPIEAYYIFFVSSPLLIFLVAYDASNYVNKASFPGLITLFSSFLSVLLTANRNSNLILTALS